MSEGNALKVEGNLLELALAFFKARHPNKTAHCVAAETGISPRTVEQWLCGNTRPGWAHTMALISAYGADFLWAVSPDSRVWLGPARKLEELRQLELQRVQLNQRIKSLGGQEHAGMDSSSPARGVGPDLLGGSGNGLPVNLDRLGRVADNSEES